MEISMGVRAFFGSGPDRASGARDHKRESLLDLTVLTCQKRKAGVLLTKIGCLSGKADVARNKSRAFTEISKFASHDTTCLGQARVVISHLDQIISETLPIRCVTAMRFPQARCRTKFQGL